MMHCRGTEKRHALAFGFAPPRRERQRMPIYDSKCCRGHFAQEPQRDGYAVDAAADNGNRDVPMRQTFHLFGILGGERQPPLQSFNPYSAPANAHSSARTSVSPTYP